MGKGFRDITCQEFANAVNHAANWLSTALGPSDGSFEVFAYEGQNDHRPAILAAAAAKVGRQLLLPFPLAPPAVKRQLVEASSCRAVLFSEPLRGAVEALLVDKHEIRRVVVPKLDDWFNDVPAPSYTYSKTFADAKGDSWLIFRTSGTTGLPKLITYNQQMMTSIGLAEAAAARFGRLATSISLFKNSRMHSSIPLAHLAGMTGALCSWVLLGTIVVLGPANRPATAAVVNDIIKYGGIEGLASSPFVIRDLYRNEEYLNRLRKLKYVFWAGAPLDTDSGSLLSKYTQLAPSIGTTECGPYFTYYCEDAEDWPYYSFVEGQGIEFEHISDGLYELVFRKKSSQAIWQQIFLLHPDLEIYRTSDVFQKHPTKPALWLFVGRTDDTIKLSSGYAVQVSPIEDSIQRCPLVKSALVCGAGRPTLFLLVEVIERLQAHHTSQRSDIQNAVEEVNRGLPGYAAIGKAQIIVADPTRPFLRSAKGSVLRKETLDLYAADVDTVYSLRLDE